MESTTALGLSLLITNCRLSGGGASKTPDADTCRFCPIVGEGANSVIVGLFTVAVTLPALAGVV